MAQPIDTGPSSSYSDPIYDRLDTVAQKVSRRWPLLLLAIAVLAFAAVMLKNWLTSNPETDSVRAFLAAYSEGDDAKRADALRKLADDEKAAPFFRARARSELAQTALDKGDTAEAKRQADLAAADARKSEDPGLELEARLALAAAAEDANDLATALQNYQEVEKRAGSRYASQQLTAMLGAARADYKLGNLDSAALRLEDITSRKDAGAENLIDYARWLYWQVKRKQAEVATGAAAPAAGEQPASSEAKPAETKPEAAKPAEPAPAPPAATTAPAAK